MAHKIRGVHAGGRGGVRGGSDEPPLFSWNEEIYVFTLLTTWLYQKLAEEEDLTKAQTGPKRRQ